MTARLALAAALVVACQGNEPAEVQLPPKQAPQATAEAKDAAPSTLDGSTGGPLRRVSITDVRMTEDVLVAGDDTVGGHVVECDPSFGSVLGQHVYTFQDDECFHGTSVTALQLLHSGRDGLGCTFRWIGRLQSTIADPFAGVGQDITRANLKDFKVLHLQVRGDGGKYRVQFPIEQQILDGGVARSTQPVDADQRTDCHEEYYDYYGQDFTCGDGTDVWTALDVPLAALKQNGFGKRYALQLDQMKRFQIVTLDHTAREFQCEVRIVGLDDAAAPAAPTRVCCGAKDYTWADSATACVASGGTVVDPVRCPADQSARIP